MAQPTLSDFIVTPASNTDFNSVGILGASLVSTADDAFRTLASMLKSGVQTGYTTVATAAGTTVLTANSNSYQYATGVTTQTYTMPTVTAAGMELGRTFTFVNNSTGALTINSSGANLIATVASGDVVTVQCILLTGTTAASWQYNSPRVVISTDAGATVGPVIEAYRNSASPATSDFLAYFRGSANTLKPGTQIDMGGMALKQTDAGAAGGSPEDGSSVVILRTRHLAGTVSSIVDSLTLAGSSTATFLGALTVSNAGTNTFGGPIDISGVQAGQIVFPAAQNASANANTLDDYEEGTFTPGMTFNASATGVTFSTQAGVYTAIGNGILVQVRIILTSNGSGVGTALVTALPFTSALTVLSPLAPVSASGFSGLTAGINADVATGGTTINMRMPTTTGSTVMTDTNVTDTASFALAGVYFKAT